MIMEYQGLAEKVDRQLVVNMVWNNVEKLTWSSIDSDENAGIHLAHSTRNSSCRFIPSITSSLVAF